MNFQTSVADDSHKTSAEDVNASVPQQHPSVEEGTQFDNSGPRRRLGGSSSDSSTSSDRKNHPENVSIEIKLHHHRARIS